jgi:CHAT domain-containing protein/Flp pilus assembly protein TadD
LPIYHAIGGKSDEARTLSNLGIVYRNLKDKLKTAEYYGQALSLYRDLQDRVHEARTLRYLGDAYRDFGDTQKALEYYNQALPIYHALANVSDEASILNTIAYLYQSLDQRQKALDYLTQELPLWRSIGKKREEADTLFNIAIIYNDFGEKQKALDCLIQALPLRRATGDRDNETLTLYDLAFIHDDLGEEQKALEYATQALTLVRAGSKRDLEPDILNLLGIVHSNLGEHQKALDHYNQALPVARALGNRKTETSVLNNIGGLYDAMGDRQKALEYYNQALALERASNDRSGQANTLAAMGLTYYTLGETENALACLNQALEHDRAAGLREHEGRTLHNIGLVYSLLGDKQTAFKYYTQALAIERETHIDAGVTLIKIGEIYSIQGELEKALDFYNQALRDTRAFKNRRDEANALLNIGGLYSNLGEYRKALEYYNQALSLTRAIHDRDIEARAVRHIGSAHTNLGENQKAIEFLNQALSLERAASNRFGEVHTLNSLGISYFNLKDNQTALKYYNESLSLARAMGNRQLEALTLNNIGLVYASTDSQKALQYYGDALSLERIIGDRDGEALALGNLMDLWGELNNPGLAILYGKQAINIYQQFRSNISGFTREIQEVFLHSREESYRALIKLLLKMNRFAEAEQVLRMLKQEEYVSALTKRGSEEAEGLAKRADLTDKERAAISEYIKYGDEVSSIWQKYDAVQKELAPLKRKSQRTPEEDARLKALNDEDQQLGLQIENGKRVFEVFLRKLEDDFKTGSIERDPKPQLSERLVSDVAELSQRTGKTVVELHAVAGRDNVTLILTTPQGQEWYESKPAISSADLAELVLNFRDKLQSPTQDPRPLGQQLYRVLMPERLQHDLDVVKAQTIVWSLDGVLRYVPTAALWDGAHYLVERYENVEIALAIDSDIKEPSPEKLTGLGLGVSRAFEPEPGLKFPKLTNVPDELGAIIRDKRLSAITRKSGLLSGRALLDPDFTGDQLLAELKSGQYQVVHFATHFKFKPAAPDQSFLLLGDGTELTLDRLRFDARNTRVFQGVSLLTLSACETAVGEAAATGGRREKAGSEVEGLAVTAQNKGAKAVMATLWEVFTGSTGDLMEDFYRNWTTNRKQGKAAALRDAQLKMLYGNVPQADRDSERKEYAEWAAHAGDATRRAFKTDTRAPYAHPFYWSPFVLIGNWQ